MPSLSSCCAESMQQQSYSATSLALDGTVIPDTAHINKTHGRHFAHLADTGGTRAWARPEPEVHRPRRRTGDHTVVERGRGHAPGRPRTHLLLPLLGRRACAAALMPSPLPSALPLPLRQPSPSLAALEPGPATPPSLAALEPRPALHTPHKPARGEVDEGMGATVHTWVHATGWPALAETLKMASVVPAGALLAGVPRQNAVDGRSPHSSQARAAGRASPAERVGTPPPGQHSWRPRGNGGWCVGWLAKKRARRPRCASAARRASPCALPCRPLCFQHAAHAAAARAIPPTLAPLAPRAGRGEWRCVRRRRPQRRPARLLRNCGNHAAARPRMARPGCGSLSVAGQGRVRAVQW
eukprot:scaffold101015_cov71-Phaeocystis_antarctica.AAC.9